MKLIKIIFLLFLCSLIKDAESQIFPVQATTQLGRPYSLYLSDYVSPGSDRLKLNVFLADVSRTDLNVRFRLRIEGQGIKIETKPEFIPPPISLQGGVPLQLISTDLADYFLPRNLNFSGISQREYEQKGALPEGFYTFSFEVLEYNRGVKISNTGSAFAWLILNDPPIVNLPRDNEKIRIQSPQQVIFQWTPRHTGSPNAAFTTEYEFKLVELWPATRNPNDAILTSPSIYETTTNSTTLIYGPAETPLEPGRRYAFRLKAKSIVGIDELNLFKNNGYSQVYTFTYGDACTLPTGIRAEATGATRFKVLWDAASNHTGYSLLYRPISKTSPSLPERGTGGEVVWYTTNTSITDSEISSLKPSTQYEYKVAATCGFIESPFSNVATITTKDTPSASYSCGVPMQKFDLDPSQLIPSLKIGDVIQAGDFEVKVSKITGSGGTFSGEGAVELPYFNKVKAIAVFNNIKVNKDNRLVSGFCEIIGGKVEVIPSEVLASLDKLDQTLDVADKALTALDSLLPSDAPDPNSFVAEKLITVPAGIKTITREPVSGTIIIVDNNGNKQTLPGGTNVAVADGKGKGAIISKGGGITNTTAAAAKATAKREYNLSLTFAAESSMQYGFDKKNNEALAIHYEKLNGTYEVPWKSISSNGTDQVLAQLQSSDIDKSKIRFEIDGQPITFGQWSKGVNESQQTIDQSLLTISSLPGGNHTLLAKYTPADTTKKEQLLGKLNITAYDTKSMTVHIIPVNGTPFTEGDKAIVQTQLKKIYAQAAVEWTVEVEKADLKVTGLASPFDNGSTGLANYTSNMKAVINAYTKGGTLQPNNYYLFLVPPGTTAGETGFMPRSKQAGFIFTDGKINANELARTMAHELGHGAFTLKHIFSEYAPAIAERTTDNLMDYIGGTALLHYQWSRIHDPAIVLGLFESDEAGASMSLPCVGIFDDCDEVLKILNVIKAKVESNKDLVLFKPDEAKKRREEYVALALDIDGEDYNKIVIKNEIKEDRVVNPRTYTDYKVDGADKLTIGFLFRSDKDSFFKILLTNERDSTTLYNKRNKLRKYLFGGTLGGSESIINLYEGENEKQENNIFIITADPPTMPDIRARVDSRDTIYLRLKIEYSARKTWSDGNGAHTNELVRQDITWYPENEWKSLKSGEVWDIDFHNTFRGGKAFLICKLNSQIADTLIFHLRGENPDEGIVHNFVNTLPNADGWYVPKMIRQESSFNQFNTGTLSITNSSAGFPNWGPPYGWGMKQLDNLGAEFGYRTMIENRVVREGGASPDELWNWQLNVSKGVQFFNDAKMPVATSRWNNAVAEIGLWERTHQESASAAYPMLIVASPTVAELNTTVTQIIAGNATNSETIVSNPNPTNNQRSLKEAHAIKFYNGGNNYFTIILPASQGRDEPIVTPYWNINKIGNGRDYVGDISGRAGW